VRHGVERILHEIEERPAERAGMHRQRAHVVDPFQLEPHALGQGEGLPFAGPGLKRAPERVRGALDGGNPYQRQILLQQVIHPRHLGLDLGERLRDLGRALRRTVVEFLL
jgi:hypothetical protein